MDKNAIKKYAVWARRELISRVSQRAALYDITEKNLGDPSADSVHGQILTAVEKKERQALIKQIQTKGYQEVMEEVAYTWFNRFSALRFMEVNGYLPSHVRVFTDDDNTFKPQILTEAINLDLEGLDMEKVYALKNENKTDELFKYLIIVQCNALSEILPGMFQKIADYTELLFPDNLLRSGSAIEQMITLIPEADWQDQVQIIGWLYQYYNSEKKDDVFAALKKNVKITKENIPAATQLFTPDWIVRYMVENSLGRLWVEGHPNAELQSQWKYYLEEAEQEPEVQVKLAEIRKEYAALNPEDIKCIDPCSGSGHILAYMFDVLVQIYEAHGYTTRDAVKSIVENNIYGLDIDDRAAQLAYFSVMMKGRQYDSRFFKRGVQPHVYAIVESNQVDSYVLDYFCNGDAKLTKTMKTIISELHDAKEYGSILTVTPQDWSALYARFEEIDEDISILKEQTLAMLPMVQVAEALGQKYDVVVTNPPYMGGSGMSAKLGEYVKKHFPYSKSDLFAVFIEQCGQMAQKNGYQAMITQHAWMFLSSFEKLRGKLQNVDTINMAHLGARAFEEIGGEVVQTTSFVLRNLHIKSYKGLYCRLVEPNTQQDKEIAFFSGKNRFITSQDNFAKIPGYPVAYWLPENLMDAFQTCKALSDFADSRSGMSTTDNNRFLRFWFETQNSSIGFGYNRIEDTSDCLYKWFPYNKGGSFRKWYGNRELVVNWYNNGEEMKYWVTHNPRDPKTKSWSRRIFNTDCSFKAGITWSALANEMSMRLCENGFMFDSKGASCFVEKERYYILAYMNSVVAREFLSILCPTLDFNPGQVAKVPVRIDQDIYLKVEELSRKCVMLSKEDWDSFETSWDFKRHPLMPHLPWGTECIFRDENGKMVSITHTSTTIDNEYSQWEQECNERFTQLKANEEELNSIFIDIYGLQDELTPEVEDKDVTVRKADLQRDIKSLISYAVGCMFGRYSLDVEGLVYAGGEWDTSEYTSFPADKDNIIPICDDEYFKDDIVNRFVKFIEVVYGKDTLEENLRFIASALGGKGQPRDVIRNYFLNDFYADHLKTYQKRPIYWIFDSGKKGGFKCLIYMHRYQPDTIARIRTDYVHEQQSRYRTAIADLENRIASASTSERVKLSKQIKKLQEQAEETRAYEEKIHHLADQMIPIDLDDGVKVNYAKFQDVLAKIK